MSRFDDIKTAFYAAIGQPSGNANVSDTQVGFFMNEAYKKIHEAMAWKWLIKEVWSYVFTYTTISALGATGTTVNVTANTDMYSGQYLVISDGTYYERAYVSAVNGTVITLSLPGIDGTYTEGDIVSGVSIPMPNDMDKLLSVRVKNKTTFTYTLLSPINDREHDWMNISYGTMGIPTHYWLRTGDALSNSIIFYPAPDDDYRILLKYYCIPANIAADVDPLFNTSNDDVLLPYMKYKFYSRVGDNPSEAHNQKMIFEKEALPAMMASATRRPGALPTIRIASQISLPTLPTMR